VGCTRLTTILWVLSEKLSEKLPWNIEEAPASVSWHGARSEPFGRL